MNTIFKNAESLGSISFMGVSLSDLALIAAWIFVLIVYVGVQWPRRPWKTRSELQSHESAFERSGMRHRPD